MKVTFPTGRFIGPGSQQIHTSREEEEEVWVLGYLIETKINSIDEIHEVDVPDPGEYEDLARGFIVDRRGEFKFADKTFIVVRDSDLDFWGGQTKAEWFEGLQKRNRINIEEGARLGWWEIDSNGNPQRSSIKISIADMQSQNKPLMAHLMVDLGFFPSVSQARKNGWDKPLELGLHGLGPKKKRTFVEIIP